MSREVHRAALAGAHGLLDALAARAVQREDEQPRAAEDDQHDADEQVGDGIVEQVVGLHAVHAVKRQLEAVRVRLEDIVALGAEAGGGGDDGLLQIGGVELAVPGDDVIGGIGHVHAQQGGEMADEQLARGGGAARFHAEGLGHVGDQVRLGGLLALFQRHAGNGAVLHGREGGGQRRKVDGGGGGGGGLRSGLIGLAVGKLAIHGAAVLAKHVHQQAAQRAVGGERLGKLRHFVGQADGAHGVGGGPAAGGGDGVELLAVADHQVGQTFAHQIEDGGVGGERLIGGLVDAQLGHDGLLEHLRAHRVGGLAVLNQVLHALVGEGGVLLLEVGGEGVERLGLGLLLGVDPGGPRWRRPRSPRQAPDRPP